MLFDFDNDGRNDLTLSEPSGWKIGGGGEGLSLGLGVDIATIGVASISAGLSGGYCWIMIVNENYPTAEHMTMPDGSRLDPDHRSWKRYYWIVMQTGGLGVSAGPRWNRSFPAVASANIDIGRQQDPADGIGFVHRWSGAPEGEDQEKGDPTGLLGAALQDGLTGTAALGPGVTGGGFTMALGARVRGRRGIVAATATRLFEILVGRVGVRHLVFNYGAAYWAVGPTVGNSLNLAINASMDICYVHRIHSFVIEPDLDLPLYCYTIGLRSDGSTARYYDRDMRGRHAYYDTELIDEYRAALRTDRSIQQLEAQWEIVKDHTRDDFPEAALENQNNRLYAYNRMLEQLEENGHNILFRDMYNRHMLGMGIGQQTLRHKIRILEDVRNRPY